MGSVTPSTMTVEGEKLTLLSLPDPPLLRVLSLLPVEALGAAARACSRLGALTREHPSLWPGRGELVEFWEYEDLLDLVRVAPRVAILRLFSVDEIDEQNEPYASARFNYRDSKLTVGTEHDVASLILELGPSLKHFVMTKYRGVSPLASLREVGSLETLYVRLVDGGGDLDWPQDAVLPKLHSVQLHCEDDHVPSGATLDALRALLQAHSGQLRFVSLGSPQLLPLLEACRGQLRRLTVAAAPGVAAGLRCVQGLEELRIILDHDRREKEVDDLLRTWPGCPLVRVELVHCGDATLGALGAGALAGVRHLVLESPYRRLHALGAALAGLPALCCLDLRAAPSPEVLRDVAAADIPALQLLIVTSCDA
ncbi:hypothetical protein FOCC_FOCC011511, partial [Frankliniella occidentalis]